ncbi:VOC family protein [Tistrella mobilis]|uniref:Glyoxalase-like domain-containing protein n=1 Tax=Tistrella mobilis (strain KA081020-065) TaxID=1110502 RepID=I3TLK1_TISMK|nr:VOC family protein [Tistrella mobilis]AFK53639.1 hypothetical protein TMO_1800 [Tistrella mobilis KA081020-065]
MQTRTGLVDIDHIMCGVSDINATVADLSRLGFSFTPESTIGGMSNRLVQMKPIRPAGAANFFELMTVNDHLRVPPLMRDILSGPDGLKMIVHLSDDIEQAAATFAKAGSPIGDSWTVGRDWVREDGEREHVRFTVLIPARGHLPFFMNAYRPDSIAQYSQARYQTHENGARHIRRVYATCPAAKLPEVVAQHEKLYGCQASTLGDDAFAIRPGDVDLVLMSEDGFASRFGLAGHMQLGLPRLAGLTIEVSDPDALAALLARNGIPATACEHALVVGPEHAAGMVIEFI